MSLWDNYAIIGYESLQALIPYQQLQRQVMSSAELTAGKRLLIAGCGVGFFDKLVVDNVNDVKIDSVDFSTSMLQRARNRCSNFSNITHQQADLCKKFPFDDAQFDVVVMTNVMYALPNAPAALKEISRVLKVGGKFILTDRKPDSTPDGIQKAHFKALSQLSIKEKTGYWVKTLPLLPSLIAVKVINNKIQQKGAEGEYFFRPTDEVTAMLQAVGLTVKNEQVVYGEQCWMLTAVKEDDKI
ncbi:MAG: class I SAM-dependent methyltransferase [bacterium]